MFCHAKLSFFCIKDCKYEMTYAFPGFTGAFDQHGCPLIVFPVDGQAKLSSDVSKAEVVDFVNYFLCLHKYVESKELIVSTTRREKECEMLT